MNTEDYSTEEYTGREWTVAVPTGTTLLNANDRDHYMTRAKKVKILRDIAWVAVKHQHIPLIQRAHIVLELYVPDKRRLDEANWAPTAKALVDGLVLADALPDDNYWCVRGPEVRVEGPPGQKVAPRWRASSKPPLSCALVIKELA